MERRISLLSTKLFVPNIPDNLLHRPSLIARFEEAKNFKLVLLSAPAGFGKTTTMVQWLRHYEMTPSWFSLDRDDNEPLAFLSYLTGSIQSVKNNLGKDLLQSLQDANPPTIRMAMSQLLNEITSIQKDLYIVLNDYHEIRSPQIHDAMVYFLEHLPSTAHVFVLTRKDPPWPLARWRAQRQLFEIRSGELKFKLDETTKLLNEHMKLDLSRKQIRLLDGRTEGWITGIQLAAMSLKSHTDTTNFLERLSGSDRYILDYLATEVLRKQPKRILDFLLQTSILNRMNTELCNTLTGYKDAHRILRWLERSNVFIGSLDEKRNWYRYHDLFRSVLHAKLKRTAGIYETELHRKASRWFEQNKLIGEAIYHAIQGKEWDRALGLMEPVAEEMFKRREHHTVENWLKDIPEEALESKPEICLWHAYGLIHGRYYDEAERPLQLAERAGAGTWLESAVWNGRGIRSIFKGEAEAFTYAQKALKAPGGNHPFNALNAKLIIGSSYVEGGHPEKALTVLKEASITAKQIGHAYGSALSGIHIGSCHLMQGRLQLASKQIEDAVGSDPYQFPEAFLYAYGLLSDLEREQNHLEKACQHVDTAMDIEQRTGCPGMLPRTYLPMARTLWSAGKREQALELIDHAIETGKRSGNDVEDPEAAAQRAHFLLLKGNRSSVQKWFLEIKNRELPDDRMHEIRNLTLARVYISEQQNDKAIDLLNRLIRKANTAKRWKRVIESCCLLALAQRSQSMTKAFDSLERSLMLAEPENFVRVFVDEGASMSELFSMILKARSKQWKTRSPALIRYVVRLQTQFNGESSKPAKTFGVEDYLPAWYLPDPLSQREIEILKLVAIGLSSQNLAKKLILAKSTVKRHLSNIFLKLDVHSRIEAVARAREFKLID